MKTTAPQASSDDIWCVTGIPGAGDDFSLDAFFKDGSFLDREDENDLSSLTENPNNPFDDNSSSFSHGLAIPGDDVGGLELWTHLMVPQTTRAYPNPKSQNMRTGFYVRNRVEPAGKKRGRVGVEVFPWNIPVKPRSKRLRPAEIRAWKSPPNTETSSSSNTSSPVSTLLFPHDMNPAFSTGNRKPSTPFGEVGGGPVFQRRCNHCQATKTPQWRAGPDGPKTLCNACGVRFKSGRLYPEYRPACSPTFLSEVHSNSHRKVLEMRRKKETVESPVGLSPKVESS